MSIRRRNSLTDLLASASLPPLTSGRLRDESPAGAPTSPRLAVVLPREQADPSDEPLAVSPCLVLCRDGIPSDADYVYAPDHPDAGWRLCANSLSNALLCLSSRDLDFAIVSNALAEPPEIEFSSLLNNVIFSRHAFASFQRSGRLPEGSRGRILRLLPRPKEAWGIRLPDPSQLGIGDMQIRGAHLSVLAKEPSKCGRAASSWDDPPRMRALGDSRKTVLVLPIFMAVGGAERNLIQVLRALKDRFAFVVVTTEPVSAARGSLNHEAIEHCECLFDLGEIAPQDDHMKLIDAIGKAMQPDLVFITNGSPWLAANASRLREHFAQIPIVDQQVYDASEGWIQHFDNPGIRSFDRFIAINRPIAQAFEERFHIDPQRIDLIHHAVDTQRFDLARRDACNARESIARLGLAEFIPDSGDPEAPQLFAEVARLTAQKRPLDFLDLARRSLAHGSRDLFLLVGDGELAGECDSFIDAHGLVNVERIPYCNDMSELYPILSGLIFTSAYEGLPVAMLEALCMGVPVLATAVGDILPVLDEVGGGRTVDPGAGPEALFDAFTTFRADLVELQAAARSASPRVIERFAANAVGERYAQAWERAWKVPTSTRSAGA